MTLSYIEKYIFDVLLNENDQFIEPLLKMSRFCIVNMAFVRNEGVHISDAYSLLSFNLWFIAIIPMVTSAAQSYAEMLQKMLVVRTNSLFFKRRLCSAANGIIASSSCGSIAYD